MPNEIVVVTKAKDLINYIFCITEKSPKKFRFSLISKMQMLSLDILENIIMANEIYVMSKEEKYKRATFQRQSLAKLKVLDALLLTAREQQCILSKQYEIASKHINDVTKLLGAWIISDNKRYKF